MKNMKVLTLTAGVGSLILASTVSADFQGLSYDVSTNANGTTVQVYVELEAGDQLNAVYGDADNSLLIEAEGGSFYQNAFGNHSVSGMNPALFGVFPSLLNDSYVTIGLETNVGNAMLDIGIDWTSFNGGGAIETDNGSWFATPDDAQVYEIGGRVLIGQFTLIAGELTGQINLQGKNADGSNWTILGEAVGVPAPGAIALLGLAGLASRRRRK
jgi:MYXO-CTERM domain-containing protein